MNSSKYTCFFIIQETLETRVEEQERRIKHYQEKIEQILEEKDQVQVDKRSTLIVNDCLWRITCHQIVFFGNVL